MSLIEQIKKHEGYRKTVYKDSLGKDTIGIGFLIDALELDEDICDEILKRILSKNEIILNNNLEWYEDASEQLKDILQNMFYQLHYNLFKFKKTLYYLETEQYEEAATECLDSLWAKQTPNRAKEVSEAISSLATD